LRITRKISSLAYRRLQVRKQKAQQKKSLCGSRPVDKIKHRLYFPKKFVPKGGK
jgi:hypothetical protein